MVSQILDMFNVFDGYMAGSNLRSDIMEESDTASGQSDWDRAKFNYSTQSSRRSSPCSSESELFDREMRMGDSTPRHAADSSMDCTLSLLNRNELLRMLKQEVQTSEQLRITLAKTEHSCEVKKEEIESLHRSTAALERERQSLRMKASELEDELFATRDSHKAEIKGLWKNIERIDNENVRLLKQLKKAEEETSTTKCDIELDPTASDWKKKLQEDIKKSKEAKKPSPSPREIKRKEEKLNAWMKNRRRNKSDSKSRRGSKNDSDYSSRSGSSSPGSDAGSSPDITSMRRTMSAPNSRFAKSALNKQRQRIQRPGRNAPVVVNRPKPLKDVKSEPLQRSGSWDPAKLKTWSTVSTKSQKNGSSRFSFSNSIEQQRPMPLQIIHNT